MNSMEFVTMNKCENHEARIDRLEHILDGNGDEGIKAKVLRHEATNRVLFKVALAIFGGLVTLVVEIAAGFAVMYFRS